jgi:Tfp pilus assembly protein PilF
MIPARKNRQLFLISAVLVLVTGALYWPTARFEFINLDDPTYILQNPKVSQGVTWNGVSWAFTHFHGANWHPLSWISHMVDVSLFGFEPAGHHLVNVGIHALNALLLFLFLRQTTGARWRSALVAAIFAWHPTHVESVAWVSERKDVLSTFFGLLTLLAYARYAESRDEGRGARKGTTPHPTLSPNEAERAKRIWYGVALFCFALGLMSKPMLVTWPFVMLLLDYWPLHRLSLKGSRGTRDEGRGISKGTTPHPTLSPDAAERAVPTAGRLVREKIPFFALTAASCVLTFLAQRAGGAVQSMEHLPLPARIANAVVSYARYLGKTFWPAELSAFYPHPVRWPDEVVLGAAVLIGGLVVVSLWKTRTHRYGFVGLCWFLGALVPVIGLIQVGGQSMADRYLYIPQIGIVLAVVWGAAEWLRQHKRGQQVGWAVSGVVLVAGGWMTHQYLPKWTNSVALFQHALTVDEKNPPALYSLGLALSAENKYAEAIPYLAQAIELAPSTPAYQGQMALVRECTGDLPGAIESYRRCLELDPTLTEAMNNLAWILATAPEAKHRNGAEAVKWATRACEVTQYDWPMFLGTLAASYAEAGRFPEAIRTAEQAEAMARKRGFTELAERNAELLKTYRAGRPHRETAPAPEGENF